MTMIIILTTTSSFHHHPYYTTLHYVAYSINDPSIWRIRCAPGKEFQLVRSIFLKHMAAQASGNNTSTLKSAFHNSSKGYIYVEAFSEVCAKEAIQGLRGLYFTTMTKVPVNEMTNVLRCTTDKVRSLLLLPLLSNYHTCYHDECTNRTASLSSF